MATPCLRLISATVSSRASESKPSSRNGTSRMSWPGLNESSSPAASLRISLRPSMVSALTALSFPPAGGFRAPTTEVASTRLYATGGVLEEVVATQGKNGPCRRWQGPLEETSGEKSLQLTGFRAVESRVGRQDRLLQNLQARRRLDAELLDQSVAQA